MIEFGQELLKISKMMEEKEESWTSQYFRDVILTQHVFSFLKNEENGIAPDQVIFVHDKAPCMRAKMTQYLLIENNVSLWGNDI